MFYSALCVAMRPFAIRDALVVDADQELRNFLPSILKPGVWAIHHVRTNKDALRFAKRKAFELIITGENTSGQEDVELLRKIRSAWPRTRLIVLANESIHKE